MKDFLSFPTKGKTATLLSCVSTIPEKERNKTKKEKEEIFLSYQCQDSFLLRIKSEHSSFPQISLTPHKGHEQSFPALLPISVQALSISDDFINKLEIMKQQE